MNKFAKISAGDIVSRFQVDCGWAEDWLAICRRVKSNIKLTCKYVHIIGGGRKGTAATNIDSSAPNPVVHCLDSSSDSPCLLSAWRVRTYDQALSWAGAPSTPCCATLGINKIDFLSALLRKQQTIPIGNSWQIRKHF